MTVAQTKALAVERAEQRRIYVLESAGCVVQRDSDGFAYKIYNPNGVFLERRIRFQIKSDFRNPCKSELSAYLGSLRLAGAGS